MPSTATMPRAKVDDGQWKAHASIPRSQLNQTSDMSAPDSSGYERDGYLDDTAAPPGLYFDGSGQRMIASDGPTLDAISQITVGAYASWSKRPPHVAACAATPRARRN